VESDAFDARRHLGWLADLPGVESEAWLELAHHLTGTEVAREKDDGVGEVDDGTVTKAECRVVEYSQKKLTVGRRRLLNFVEENERQTAVADS